MMSIGIVRGIASTSVSAWIRQGSTLGLYMVAARSLSSSSIGVFALSAAIVLIFEYAVYDSVSESVVQRIDPTPALMSAALAMAVALSGMIAGSGFLFAGQLAALFDLPPLDGLIQPMAAAVAILCLSAAHFGLLRRQERFHTIALITTIAAVVATTTGVLLLLTGAGLKAMVAYFLIEKVILCAGSLWAARAYPLARFSRGNVTDLIPYASAIGAQRMVFYARTQMDRVVIGAFWGSAALGTYQIAARIFDSITAVILLPISKMVFVSYTKLQGDPRRLNEVFIQSLQGITLIAFPAFLGISAVAPEVIRLLFGANWTSSAIILEILGFGGLALTISVISGMLLSAIGRSREFLLVEIGSMLVGISLLVLASPFGFSWMAMAFVLRETLAVAFYVFTLRRYMDLDPFRYMTCFLPCFIASVMMWLVVNSINTGDLLSGSGELVMKIVLGALVYLVFMLVLGRNLIEGMLRLLAAPVKPSKQ